LDLQEGKKERRSGKGWIYQSLVVAEEGEEEEEEKRETGSPRWDSNTGGMMVIKAAYKKSLPTFFSPPPRHAVMPPHAPPFPRGPRGLDFQKHVSLVLGRVTFGSSFRPLGCRFGPDDLTVSASPCPIPTTSVEPNDDDDDNDKTQAFVPVNVHSLFLHRFLTSCF
ncbi:hypothetical protein L249_4008, partial [Ophiocordyceps polyrhachis-furcata BCC 54312]